VDVAKSEGCVRTFRSRAINTGSSFLDTLQAKNVRGVRKELWKSRRERTKELTRMKADILSRNLQEVREVKKKEERRFNDLVNMTMEEINQE
jgi:hypothetical protein